mgnify:CR=1 FL=1
MKMVSRIGRAYVISSTKLSASVKPFYTSMWGTDAESVTPGNLYKVYKANDAFLYLLNRLSEAAPAISWAALAPMLL